METNEYSLLPMTAADVDSVNGIKPDTWQDLTTIHRFYTEHDFCHPIKACLDGRMVGYGTAIVYRGTGWLAHIIVSDQHRNKGIGGRIVTALNEYMLTEGGCRTLTLTATDQGYPVYVKKGFVVESEYIVCSRDTESAVPETPRHIRPLEAEDTAQLLSLDRMVSGEVRDGILLPFTLEGFVYAEGNAVRGYYLPTLGEGTVVAADQEAGRALLRMKAAAVKRIILPSENSGGREFLKELGFAETGTIRRMRLGPAFEWQPQHVFCRIGGFAG